MWFGERLKRKTRTRTLLVSVKVPDPYHRNGTLLQFRMRAHQTHRERCQLVSTGEKKMRRKGERKRWRNKRHWQDTKWRRCLPNNRLHERTAHSRQAWSGLSRTYTLWENKPSLYGKHIEGRAVCVAHCPFMERTNRSFQHSCQCREDLRHFVTSNLVTSWTQVRLHDITTSYILKA